MTSSSNQPEQPDDPVDPEQTVQDDDLRDAAPSPDTTADDVDLLKAAQSDDSADSSLTAEEDNPDATIDDESLLAVDPAATIEPQMNSDAKADWDASMTEDSDPDETIKGSLELPDERSTPHHQTTVLKQREIVRDDGSSSVANVTGETDYSIEGLLGEERYRSGVLGPSTVDGSSRGNQSIERPKCST